MTIENGKMDDHWKYPSHTNHYDGKSVTYLMNKHADLLAGQFQITEKIHGSNISFIVSPLVPVRIASRKHILGDGADLFGVKAHLSATDRYNDLLIKLQLIADARGVTLQLYGEFFGKGIMTMDYGDNKQIRFFDLRVDDIMATKHSFNQIVPVELAAPVYATDLSFEDAMAWDIETETVFGTGRIEGVVISPLHDASKFGASRFNVKKKSDSFIEKKSRVKAVAETRLVELKADFMQYVNMARVETVLNNNGGIQSQKEIGKFIGLIMRDAQEDFVKEYEGQYDLESLTQKDRKYIYNVGGAIVPMLKEQLSR